jgi:hypothetical protein
MHLCSSRAAQHKCEIERTANNTTYIKTCCNSRGFTWLGALSAALRFCQRMSCLQLALGTQLCVFALIVAIFTILGKVADIVHKRLVAHEKVESMENTSQATTATVVKPLTVLLPIFGWLVGFQRAVTGVCGHRMSRKHSLIHLPSCIWAPDVVPQRRNASLSLDSSVNEAVNQPWKGCKTAAFQIVI